MTHVVPDHTRDACFQVGGATARWWAGWLVRALPAAPIAALACPLPCLMHSCPPASPDPLTSCLTALACLPGRVSCAAAVLRPARQHSQGWTLPAAPHTRPHAPHRARLAGAPPAVRQLEHLLACLVSWLQCALRCWPRLGGPTGNALASPPPTPTCIPSCPPTAGHVVCPGLQLCGPGGPGLHDRGDQHCRGGLPGGPGPRFRWVGATLPRQLQA